MIENKLELRREARNNWQFPGQRTTVSSLSFTPFNGNGFGILNKDSMGTSNFRYRTWTLPVGLQAAVVVVV